MKFNLSKQNVQTARHKKLIAAIEKNDNARVKVLICEMPPQELSYNDSIDGTALHIAIGFRNEGAAKLLIEKMLTEAISAGRDTFRYTALIKAAYYRMNETVKLLLNKVSNEDICAVDFLNKNVLHYGAKTLGIEVLKLLLDKMPKSALHVVSEDGAPLHIAVFIQAIHAHLPCARQVMELLIKRMSIAEIDILDLEGKTPLMLAIEYNKIEIIDLLIAKGATMPPIEEINFSKCSVLVQVYISDSVLADKIYNGELVEPIEVIWDKDLFLSRLTSKIATNGMPEGCTDIRKYLEDYKLGLSSQSIGRFIENLSWVHFKTVKESREKIVKTTDAFKDPNAAADINTVQADGNTINSQTYETEVIGAEGLLNSIQQTNV